MSRKSDDSRDYEVGYGKPPKRTQFKPGRSGNPRGRPKERLNNRTILQSILGHKVTVTENGRSVKKTMHEILMTRPLHEAAKGNLKAAELIWKMMVATGFGMQQEDKVQTTNLSPDDEAIIAEALARAGSKQDPAQ